MKRGTSPMKTFSEVPTYNYVCIWRYLGVVETVPVAIGVSDVTVVMSGVTGVA